MARKTDEEKELQKIEKNLKTTDFTKEEKKLAKQEISSEIIDLADELTEKTTIDKEQAIAESIRLLGKTKDIDTLSELDNEEIIALCAINIMHEEFDIDVLEDLSNHYIKFRVSKSRKGRKGIEDILKHTLNERDSLISSIKGRMDSWIK